MKKVLKYELEVKDYQEIVTPWQRTPLSVGIENGVPYVYALVDTKTPSRKLQIVMANTGHPLYTPKGDIVSHPNFIGTVQTEGGGVWHVFYLV